MTNPHPLILKACELSGQTVERFMHGDSKREIAQVRQAVYMVLHKQGLSQTQIAKTTGRHHSSIQHGLEVASGLLSYDKDFIKFYQELETSTP
jgi:chromosomal replication initiation ATPase DnaA